MTAPRQDRSVKTRQSFVDAAIELIAEGGVAAVTQRKVAARAERSLATTTYHFATAEDLVVASFEEAAARSIDRLAELVDAVENERLGALDAVLAFVSADDPAIDVIPHLTVAAAHRPRLRAASEQFISAFAALFEGQVTEHARRVALSRCFVGIMSYEIGRGREHRPTDDLIADMRELLRAFPVTDDPPATDPPSL